MTPEKLHEAIGMLPSDLVAEADGKRNQLPRKNTHYKQLAAMAACFALVLACGLFLTRLGLGGTKGASTEMAQAAPEAPAALAPETELKDMEIQEEAAGRGEAGGGAQNTLRGDSPAEEEAAYAHSSLTADMAVPAQFAVRLLRSTHTQGQNTLVSPLSVFSALAMTAQGAQNQTLAQMEDVLTMDAGAMADWLAQFQSQEELKLANAIWFSEDDRLTVEKSFLNTCRADFQAEIYQAPMNQETCDAINAWVSRKTDGMIPEILDKIPEDAMLYLVNALSFDAQWRIPYSDYQITDGIFTTEDGREQEMELMHSKEHLYLEDDYATGFIKRYDNSRYGFAVLLPKEDMTLSAYLETLTGEHLQELLLNPADAVVYGALPKFETEFTTELSEALISMGMTDAFNANTADFSAMGTCRDGNLFISRVLHKTFLSVAEQGTQAGAATVIEMAMGAALEQDIKEVTLDRPFVYMIVDMELGFPIFIGTMEDMAH